MVLLSYPNLWLYYSFIQSMCQRLLLLKRVIICSWAKCRTPPINSAIGIRRLKLEWWPIFSLQFAIHTQAAPVKQTEIEIDVKLKSLKLTNKDKTSDISHCLAHSTRRPRTGSSLEIFWWFPGLQWLSLLLLGLYSWKETEHVLK